MSSNPCSRGPGGASLHPGAPAHPQQEGGASAAHLRDLGDAPAGGVGHRRPENPQLSLRSPGPPRSCAVSRRLCGLSEAAASPAGPSPRPGRPPEPPLGSRSPGLTAASHVDLPPCGARHTVLCPLCTRPSPQWGRAVGPMGRRLARRLCTRGAIPCEPTGGPAGLCFHRDPAQAERESRPR